MSRANINLHIERVVLEGTDIARSESGDVRTTIEKELTRLLVVNGMNSAITSLPIATKRDGGSITFGGANLSNSVGSEIATAIHRSLSHPPTGPSSNEGSCGQ